MEIQQQNQKKDAQELWYGAQTACAVENFRLGAKKTHPALIFAMVTVKQAVAQAYQKLLPQKRKLYLAMERACQEILTCEREYEAGADSAQWKVRGIPFTELFVTEALQGGAGTSTHMNVNEVLAKLTALNLAESRNAQGDAGEEMEAECGYEPKEVKSRLEALEGERPRK